MATGPRESFKDSSSSVEKEAMAAVLVAYLFLTAPELRISWLSRPSSLRQAADGNKPRVCTALCFPSCSELQGADLEKYAGVSIFLSANKGTRSEDLRKAVSGGKWKECGLRGKARFSGERNQKPKENNGGVLGCVLGPRLSSWGPRERGRTSWDTFPLSVGWKK